MRTKSNAEKNISAGIIFSAPWRLINVESQSDYTLKVKFLDGTIGLVDMSQLIMSNKAGVFARLRDKTIFAQVFIQYGVVTWPGDIDLAPDAMYDEIKLHGKWILK